MKIANPNQALAHGQVDDGRAQEMSTSSLCERECDVFSCAREVRMQKNRVSAAKSRQVKREYIEHLERQVGELMGIVETLRAENLCLQAAKPVAKLEDALCAEWEEMAKCFCFDLE